MDLRALLSLQSFNSKMPMTASAQSSYLSATAMQVCFDAQSGPRTVTNSRCPFLPAPNWCFRPVAVIRALTTDAWYAAIAAAHGCIVTYRLAIGSKGHERDEATPVIR